MKLLPPAPDKCPTCAVKHSPNAPHDKQSMYYQYRFRGSHGRWPTWADAIAHCPPEIRAAWEHELRRMRHWSEPDDGEPIADPPLESFHQVVEVGGGPTVVAMNPEDQ